jgi:UDP-N-acetylmuramoyl-tripeptide--D-alanyl-D-alanine ligase
MALSDSTTVHICATKEDALKLVREMNSGDVVLVKASRAEKFEDLAQGIEEQIALLIADSGEVSNEEER